MRNIPIERVPNQSLSITVDGGRWDIAIKACGRIMAVDIAIDGEPIVSGIRAVAGGDIIPFRYLTEHGNLFFITEDDALPWWEEFNGTQSLVYLTPDELRDGIDDD